MVVDSVGNTFLFIGGGHAGWHSVRDNPIPPVIEFIVDGTFQGSYYRTRVLIDGVEFAAYRESSLDPIKVWEHFTRRKDE